MRFVSLLFAAAMTLNPLVAVAQTANQGGPLIDYGTRFIPEIAAKGKRARQLAWRTSCRSHS